MGATKMKKSSGVMDRIAFSLGRRDDQPTLELAKDLSARRDKKGIRALAAGVRDPEPRKAGGCLKVLYEIGDRDPSLIAEYAPVFLDLLDSRANRLVWGAMTALSVVAEKAADLIYARLGSVLKAFEQGSVITVDRGVTVLASLCRADVRYEKRIWPVIMRHLETCRPKELPRHAERALVAVNAGNEKAFLELLRRRKDQLSRVQQVRIEKIEKGNDRTRSFKP